MRKLLFAIVLVTVFTLSANARADVAGDIRAGFPLSQVITNGLNAGLSIETVVTQAINAGADPVAVVTAAITARPSSAYSICYTAVSLRPALAVNIMNAALGVPGVNAGSVITAAATAVASDPDALASLRTAALNAGVPQFTVDTAIATATPAPAGLVRGGFKAEGGIGGIGGTGGTGGYGYGGIGSSSYGGGGVDSQVSPSR